MSIRLTTATPHHLPAHQIRLIDMSIVLRVKRKCDEEPLEGLDTVSSQAIEELNVARLTALHTSVEEQLSSMTSIDQIQVAENISVPPSQYKVISRLRSRVAQGPQAMDIYDVRKDSLGSSEIMSSSKGDTLTNVHEEDDPQVNMNDFMAMMQEYLILNNRITAPEPSTSMHQADQSDNGDNYVYDIYIQDVSTIPANLNNVNQFARIDWSDDVAYLQNEEDDDESDDNSEDSNAEDYYGNDYPDEEEDGLRDSDNNILGYSSDGDCNSNNS